MKMSEMSDMSKNPPLLSEAVRTEAEALVGHMLGHVTIRPTSVYSVLLHSLHDF